MILQFLLENLNIENELYIILILIENTLNLIY